MKTTIQNLVKSKYIIVIVFVLSSLTKLFGQCPTPISISVDTISSNCMGCCNGTATINVSGGCPPYQYVITPSTNGGSLLNNLCSGIYTVTVIDNNCCPSATSTFLLKQASTVGIKENKNISLPFIYPNPTNNSISINNLIENSIVTIYDAIGQEVLKYSNTNSELFINLEKEKPGIYTIKISSKNKDVYNKIIKY